MHGGSATGGEQKEQACVYTQVRELGWEATDLGDRAPWAAGSCLSLISYPRIP